MTALASLYEILLDGLNVTQAPNGDLSYQVGSASIVLMVDDKRLVMPTDEVLRSGLKADRVAFHPLSEKPMRGESEVFKKLRGLVTTKLTSSIATMAVKILEIAADPTKHKKLPAEAKKLLKQVATADEKTVKAFGKLVAAMAEHPEGRLVKIYTRRSAQLDGVNYLRMASLQFPFMDCFEDGKKEVLGVKLRDKDLESIQGVIEAILPSVRVANTYSAGSNSMTAPYMVSLLTAYARIAARINEVDELFSKVTLDDEDEVIAINLAWVDLINNPDAYQGQIPVLNGNEGSLAKGDEEVDREVEVPDARANARNGIKPLTSSREDDDAPPFKPDTPKAVAPTVPQLGEQPSVGVSFSRPAAGGVTMQQRRNMEETREDRGRDERRDSRGNDRRDDDRRYETRSDRSARGDRSWGNDGSRWEDGRGRGRDDRYDDRGRDRDDRGSRYRDDRDDRDSRRYRDDRDDRGRDRYRDDRDYRGGGGRDRSSNDTFGRGGRGSGGI